MLDKNILEMIYRKIDNEISADEEAVLDEIFEKSPEAVREYESMIKLSEYYRKNEINTPHDMKSEIMKEIESAHKQKVTDISMMTRHDKSAKKIFSVQSIFPFAFGAVAAALFMTFIIKSPDINNAYDPNDLRGTIVSRTESQPAEESVSRQLPLLDGENYLSVAHGAELTVVRVSFSTYQNAYFDFSVDSDNDSFVAYERSSDAAGIVNIENGNFMIAQPGNGVYSFFFRNVKGTSFAVNYHISIEDNEITDNLEIAL